MRGLLLLFIIVPIAEMWVLIEVGSEIGALPTIALVFLTAIVGVGILRHQGFSTMIRAQDRMRQGELPGQELIEGFLLAIGGVLLLTPGFITDSMGLVLLLPPSRKAAARWLLRTGSLTAFSGRPGATFTSFTFRRGPMHRDAGRFYEGEYTREPESRTPLDSPERGDDGK